MQILCSVYLILAVIAVEMVPGVVVAMMPAADNDPGRWCQNASDGVDLLILAQS
jgi:hypothetical protein